MRSNTDYRVISANKAYRRHVNRHAMLLTPAFFDTFIFYNKYVDIPRGLAGGSLQLSDNITGG
jgi:hypothetical protein